jgi:hypothetical protein
VARIGPPDGGLFGRFPYPACCRSSVVEHSIGNGEVDSSILSGSTSFLKRVNGLKLRAGIQHDLEWHLHAEQSTKCRAKVCRIRAVGSGGVLMLIGIELFCDEARRYDSAKLFPGA